jgi:hypothetical protein
VNFKTSQFKVFIFQKLSENGIPLGFFVKSCRNFQNTPFFFRKKNCSDLSVDENLMEFVKIKIKFFLLFIFIEILFVSHFYLDSYING